MLKISSRALLYREYLKHPAKKAGLSYESPAYSDFSSETELKAQQSLNLSVS